MVYTNFAYQNNRTQDLIDAIAWDIKANNGIFYENSGADLADLLGLCPEQNVWMYEPDPQDPDSDTVYATFRLHASTGMTFHLSCRVDPRGNVLEWIGPHDIIDLEVPAQQMIRKGIAA